MAAVIPFFDVQISEGLVTEVTDWRTRHGSTVFHITLKPSATNAPLVVQLDTFSQLQASACDRARQTGRPTRIRWRRDRGFNRIEAVELI